MYADLVSAIFRDAGHQVETVVDGQAACERIAANPAWFDLLITDHQMPRLDGLGLVTAARKCGFAGRIIVHAGNLSEDQRLRYLALRVDHTVQKGRETNRLLSLAESLLRKDSSSRPGC